MPSHSILHQVRNSGTTSTRTVIQAVPLQGIARVCFSAPPSPPRGEGDKIAAPTRTSDRHPRHLHSRGARRARGGPSCNSLKRHRAFTSTWSKRREPVAPPHRRGSTAFRTPTHRHPRHLHSRGARCARGGPSCNLLVKTSRTRCVAASSRSNCICLAPQGIPSSDHLIL
jgi:hypothetical protein